MSDRTPGAGPGRADDDASGGPQSPARHGSSTSRRRPAWVWVLGVVVLVAAVAAVVLVLGNRGGADPVVAQQPQVVTLPVPSPTIEPIEREDGTAFYDALPSTVLDYALTDSAEEPELLADGALEGYRLVYGDGGTREVVVQAGQWETAAEVDEAFDAITAAVKAATGSSEDAPGELEEGAVEANGEQVGRYLLLPRESSETVWWTNGTVLLRADGASVRDVYAAFPL